MDLLTGNVKKLYFRYLGAAFGSAIISSIYGLVDTAMVGQYHGPQGAAAMAVVAPVWNIIYSLGLLAGIGGSVLFSTARGQGQSRREREYFSAALLGVSGLAIISWLVIFLLDAPLLTLFGADQALLPLAQAYLLPVKWVVPVFLFNQMLAAFLRNDGDPGRAAAAVLSGGIFNIIGDYFFVFALDMGIFGAGLATAIGSVISLLVALTHFLSPKNTLRFLWPSRLPQKLRAILVTGFSTFFIDIAMGILTTLFNRQIMSYLGTDALAVYGIIVNISTIVQCCAYSVGQAAQPILSINFGAHQWDRLRLTLRYALWATAFFSLAWTALIWAAPNGFVRIFMDAGPDIYAIAPAILRTYGLSFLLLPLNIFSTYYFQSLLRPAAAFFVSVARGLVISGGLILSLPALLGPEAVWLAMPVTEGVVALAVVLLIRRYTGGLGRAEVG